MEKRSFQSGLINITFFSLLFLASCSTERTDTEILKEVNDEIGSVGYEAVHANVRNKIVILTGQCEGVDCAEKLEKKIKEINGVEAVQTDITEKK